MGFLKQVAIALALPVMLATLGSPAAAQGVQTGELTGIVTSSDGLTLPGATVTVQSPALQGVRTVVTDENGAYVIRALPPGQYQVTFEMTGLQTKTEKAVIELGRPTALNATLALAGVQEAVTVTADVTTAALTSPTIGANYNANEIAALPTGSNRPHSSPATCSVCRPPSGGCGRRTSSSRSRRLRRLVQPRKRRRRFRSIACAN